MRDKILAVGLCLSVNLSGVALADSLNSVNSLDHSFAGAAALKGSLLPRTHANRLTAPAEDFYPRSLVVSSGAGLAFGGFTAWLMRHSIAFKPGEGGFVANIPKRNALRYAGYMTLAGAFAGATEKATGFTAGSFLGFITALVLMENFRPATLGWIVGSAAAAGVLAQTIGEHYPAKS